MGFERDEYPCAPKSDSTTTTAATDQRITITCSHCNGKGCRQCNADGFITLGERSHCPPSNRSMNASTLVVEAMLEELRAHSSLDEAWKTLADERKQQILARCEEQITMIIDANFRV